jgi:superfamily II DNA helicase RecQ
MSLLAIDEAHCIVEWGSTFRSSLYNSVLCALHSVFNNYALVLHGAIFIVLFLCRAPYQDLGRYLMPLLIRVPFMALTATATPK